MNRASVHNLFLCVYCLVICDIMSSRKYPSGSEKRKRKKQSDDFIETQRGAMNKFLKSAPPCTSTNPNNELAIVAVEEDYEIPN